ncbi:hypothetical protein [Carboxylicivirga linearis]|uniref:Uncharacterized protein n=1 Tax=Carboxylicivirga linearis TaxID=1628157 RepID=A0ABS5JWI8_9BACT|nr:hypothetical protein [Carboxylicivirga linearis]MBS2099280.1 hypothetical protein [Carboxylicivirga linearis]
MKNITLSIVLLACSALLSAQSPHVFSYQSVIRDSDNNLVTNTQIGVLISIIRNAPTGEVVFTQEMSAETNEHGLLTLHIGEGSNIDQLSDINWGAGTYYLKADMDLTGGRNHTITVINQMLSVPYALYALKAGSIDNSDPDPQNEIQELSIDGNVLSLSGSGSVTLPYETLAKQVSNQIGLLKDRIEELKAAVETLQQQLEGYTR